MVEDFKHDRYKDDARVRNAEVNSSMGVSGTAGSLGMVLQIYIVLAHFHRSAP